MKLRDIIATASSNMFRSKLRTLLTITAIFIGAFTLTLTTGLGAGISKYIDQQVNSLGAKDVLLIQSASGADYGLPGEPKKYDSSKRTASSGEGNATVVVLTPADLDKIRKTKGIKSVDPYQLAIVDYVAGTPKDKYQALVDKFLTGESFPLEAGRYPANDGSDFEALIPATYLKALGYDSAKAALNKTIRLAVTDGLGQQSEVSVKIVGVEQKSLVAGNSLYLNTPMMAKLLEAQRVGVPTSSYANSPMAFAHFDAKLSDTQQQELKDRLKTAGYKAQTVEDSVSSFRSVVQGIVLALDGFAIIALLAAGFGIINTLLMSVQERTKEIGLMKAMGMGPNRIFMLFSFEAMMIGFWGSLLGALVAITVGTIASNIIQKSLLKDLVGLQLMVFTPASVLAIIGVVMALAFVAGTLPAARAARQNPIDSLRYE